MTSGKKGSNPLREFICEYCGNKFTKLVYPSVRTPRFCCVAHRNTANSRLKVKKIRKGETACKVCGKFGERKGDYCNAHAPSRIINNVWTEKRIEFLKNNYHEIGSMECAKKLGVTQIQVLNRVSMLGLKLNKEATKRIVNSKAREYMTEHNPMKNPAIASKVGKKVRQRYWSDEEYRVKYLDLMSKDQRKKASKPELLCKKYLEELGVDFIHSEVIKPKFIVDFKLDNLIIQVDGEYWHGHPRFEPLSERQIGQQKRDAAQDKYLTTCGYKVVRIWERDITLDAIQEALS